VVTTLGDIAFFNPCVSVVAFTTLEEI
jgi:hypothetical protein